MCFSFCLDNEFMSRRVLQKQQRSLLPKPKADGTRLVLIPQLDFKGFTMRDALAF